MANVIDFTEYREEKSRRRKKAPEKVYCEMCEKPLNKREERSGICDNCFEEIMGRR